MKKATFKDFQKLDIRVGTVVKAEVPKWSHWVTKLTVNFGKEIGQKIVFAGVMHFYKPKDLESKQFPFVVNLEPKKIGPEGDYSEAMLLAASPVLNKPIIIEGEKLKEKPVLFNLLEAVPNGTKIR